MITVIPSILESSFEEVKKKVKRIEGIFPLAQIDICDGRFVPSQTFQDPTLLSSLPTNVEFEIQLMVEHPEQQIMQWMSLSNVIRVIAHVEAMESFEELLHAKDHFQKELGLAVKLETPIAVVQSFFEDIDLLLMMGIEPGAQGRPMDPRVIRRVSEVKQIRDQQEEESFAIAVDGGVNDGTAPELIAAGCDILNVGSYLFSQSDLKHALRQLQAGSR